MKILIGGDIVPKTDEVKQLFVEGDTKTLFGDVCDFSVLSDRLDSEQQERFSSILRFLRTI